MIPWEAYNQMLGTNNRDNTIRQAKENFIKKAVDNPGYRPNAKRNGAIQPVLVDRTEVAYKYKIISFPDDPLEVGDIFDIDNEHWIVIETRVMNSIQVVGIAWLCNHLFRFQNHSSKIIERWGVIDSGVYSTTLKGDNLLQTLHKQYKIFLPYDEETKKLYIDKRIAVGTTYNANNEQILVCMKYTGTDPTSRSYGRNGHLLIMNVESAEYDAEVDNLEEGICNYIAHDDRGPDKSKAYCLISGRKEIKPGTRKSYTAEFYNSYDNVVKDIEPVWTVVADSQYITYDIKDNVLSIYVSNVEDLIGSSFKISLTSKDGVYGEAVYEVEVVY